MKWSNCVLGDDRFGYRMQHRKQGPGEQKTEGYLYLRLNTNGSAVQKLSSVVECFLLSDFTIKIDAKLLITLWSVSTTKFDIRNLFFLSLTIERYSRRVCSVSL